VKRKKKRDTLPRVRGRRGQETLAFAGGGTVPRENAAGREVRPTTDRERLEERNWGVRRKEL